MTTFRSSPPGAADGHVTIGVAIAVPEPWATALHEYRMDLDDPNAVGVPTHITLVPPTEVPRELTGITDHLEQAAKSQGPFRVRLRGTGTFRPVSPVVFIGLAEGIAQCEILEDAVRRGPLADDPTFPYHPHVTIAHQVSEEKLDRAFAELAGFECEFEVRDFHLYVHQGAAGWQTSRTFAL